MCKHNNFWSIPTLLIKAGKTVTMLVSHNTSEPLQPTCPTDCTAIQGHFLDEWMGCYLFLWAHNCVKGVGGTKARKGKGPCQLNTCSLTAKHKEERKERRIGEHDTRTPLPQSGPCSLLQRGPQNYPQIRDYTVHGVGCMHTELALKRGHPFNYYSRQYKPL